jgi:flagellar FliL protein
MANEAALGSTDEQGESAEAPAPRRRNRGKLVALIALLLSAAGGAGAYFAFEPQLGPEPRAETPAPPQYVNLEPFTVNLRDDGSSEHYLQLGLVYQVAASAPAEAMKLHLPAIRSAILLLLSSKAPSELATPEGKAKLARELLAAARAPLAGEDSTRGILAVHFSSFIIQ